MSLFIVVIAILFVQVWGAQNPFHNDQWFALWRNKLRQTLSPSPHLHFFLALAVPLAGLGLVLWLLAQLSEWFLLPAGVILLLYSFGRGEFSALIRQYTRACAEDDWDKARQRAEKIGVSTEAVAAGDWSNLHLQMLDEAAYRGFERMFAVLFWFFVFGPLAALAYRLAYLYAEQEQSSAFAKKILWGLEWLPVRVLGLSFAVTGNFVGCMQCWRERVLCFQLSTRETMGRFVLGALSVDDKLIQTCDVTRRELGLMDGLYRRTVWLWLALAALSTLMN